MFITKELLIEKRACTSFVKWFGKNFSKGADHVQVLGELNAIKDVNGYVEYILESFRLTGTYNVWDKQGQLWRRFEYVDGERQPRFGKNGRFTIYRNGRLVAESYYFEDRLHGPYRRWGPDGELIEDCEYVRGVKRKVDK